MSERLPDSPNADVFAGMLIEVLRDTHPGIVDGWDEDVRQSVLADGPADIWPDYHTAEGAEWWLKSEIRICRSSMCPDQPEAYTHEQAVINICEATLMVLSGFMQGGAHE